MLTSKPTTKPDLTIRDIRIDAENLVIYYKLYYSKDDSEMDWTIPVDSAFVPPDGFTDGSNWSVWTEDISKTRKKDYDWTWLEPIRNNQTALTRKIKQKKIGEQFAKVDSEIAILKSLFEGF